MNILLSKNSPGFWFQRNAMLVFQFHSFPAVKLFGKMWDLHKNSPNEARPKFPPEFVLLLIESFDGGVFLSQRRHVASTFITKRSEHIFNYNAQIWYCLGYDECIRISVESTMCLELFYPIKLILDILCVLKMLRNILSWLIKCEMNDVI